jgi:hypothetical protein
MLLAHFTNKEPDCTCWITYLRSHSLIPDLVNCGALALILVDTYGAVPDPKPRPPPREDFPDLPSPAPDARS